MVWLKAKRGAPSLRDGAGGPMRTVGADPVWFDAFTPSEAIRRGWDADVMIVELPPPVAPTVIAESAPTVSASGDATTPRRRRRRRK